MNKFELSSYNRAITFETFCVNNGLILEGDTHLQDLRSQIAASKTRIDQNVPLQASSSTDLTDRKGLNRNSVERTLCRISGYLVSYGNLMGLPEFKKLSECTEYQLGRLSDNDLINQAETTFLLINQNKEAATQAGITEELIKRGTDELSAFRDWLLKPKEFRKSQSLITRMIKSDVKNIDHILDKVMYGYVKSHYGETHPTLVEEFENAIRPFAPAVFKRALFGTIIEKETGNPISGVKISIDGRKPKIHGGAKGKFHFNRLAPGIHTLVFSKKSYHDISCQVVITQGEMQELQVQLAKVKVDQPSSS